MGHAIGAVLPGYFQGAAPLARFQHFAYGFGLCLVCGAHRAPDLDAAIVPFIGVKKTVHTCPGKLVAGAERKRKIRILPFCAGDGFLHGDLYGKSSSRR